MRKKVIKKQTATSIFLACHSLNMRKNLFKSVTIAVVAVFLSLSLPVISALSSPSQGQNSQPGSDAQKDQNIPDAPSAVQPPKTLPEAPPANSPQAAPNDQQAPSPRTDNGTATPENTI